VQRQPDGFLLRVGPFHPMALMRKNMDIIPRTHPLRFYLAFKQQACLPAQQDDPFIRILIISFTGRRSLPRRNDTFQLEMLGIEQGLKDFLDLHLRQMSE
jgi:hypothetical protein